MTTDRRLSTNRDDPNQGAYNGFSYAERHSTSRFVDQHKDERPRFPPKGWRCACCMQETGSIWWHAEDYRMPCDQFPVCPWCHWSLHARFKYPKHFTRWVEMVDSGWVPLPHQPGQKWHDFNRLYLQKTPDYWDGAWHGTSPPEHSLLHSLSLEYTPYVPPHLAVADGAPHHPYQWKSPSGLKMRIGPTS